MKTFRTVLAILVGWMLSGVLIAGIDMASFVLYRPDDGRSLKTQIEDMQKDPKTAKAWLEAMPASALLLVLAGWQIGALVGGAVAALIAGRARLIHAGIIGALVLAGTVFNVLNMKEQYGFSHPNWMVLAGLLLPLPTSLLGGWLVSPRTPPPAIPMETA